MPRGYTKQCTEAFRYRSFYWLDGSMFLKLRRMNEKEVHNSVAIRYRCRVFAQAGPQESKAPAERVGECGIRSTHGTSRSDRIGNQDSHEGRGGDLLPGL